MAILEVRNLKKIYTTRFGGNHALMDDLTHSLPEIAQWQQAFGQWNAQNQRAGRNVEGVGRCAEYESRAWAVQANAICLFVKNRDASHRAFSFGG